MTLTVELSPQGEAWLEARARALGLAPAEVVRRVVDEQAGRPLAAADLLWQEIVSGDDARRGAAIKSLAVAPEAVRTRWSRTLLYLGNNEARGRRFLARSPGREAEVVDMLGPCYLLNEVEKHIVIGDRFDRSDHGG